MPFIIEKKNQVDLLSFYWLKKKKKNILQICNTHNSVKFNLFETNFEINQNISIWENDDLSIFSILLKEQKKKKRNFFHHDDPFSYSFSS